MGVDGWTFIGDAVVIVCFGLQDTQKEQIDRLFQDWNFEYTTVLPDIGADAVSDSYIIVWASKPEQILTDNRRPLILQNREQYITLGAPPAFEDQNGIDLDSKELWDPSYVNQLWMFTQEDPMGGPILQKAILRLQTETNSPQRLLTGLMEDNQHTLIGKFLAYVVA